MCGNLWINEETMVRVEQKDMGAKGGKSCTYKTASWKIKMIIKCKKLSIYPKHTLLLINPITYDTNIMYCIHKSIKDETSSLLLVLIKVLWCSYDIRMNKYTNWLNSSTKFKLLYFLKRQRKRQTKLPELVHSQNAYNGPQLGLNLAAGTRSRSPR